MMGRRWSVGWGWSAVSGRHGVEQRRPAPQGHAHSRDAWDWNASHWWGRREGGALWVRHSWCRTGHEEEQWKPQEVQQ